jgi:hypothetical protein
MAFDISDDGTIKLTPLVQYDCGVVADSGCVFRFVFARPEDQHGTASLVVQAAISAVQAESLVEDLQKMLKKIREASQGTAH